MTWLTASSPEPAARRGSAAGAWTSVVVFAVIAVALASSPWWAYSEQPGATATTGLVLFGLAVLTVAVCAYALRIHRPHNQVSALPASRPGLEIRLSNHLLLAVTLMSLVWTAFLLWSAVAAGLGSAGLLVLVLALPFAALLPDTVRALLRRPRVVLDQSGLAVVGWSTDAAVSWPDVAGVDLAAPHVRRPVVRVEVRPGATSFTSTRRKLLVSLDLAPDRPAIDVPLLALAAPGRFAALLERLASSGEADRAQWLDGRAVRFLEGSSPAALG